MDFTVFQEPRGIMRIIQLVFSICAFSVITGYSGIVHYACENIVKSTTIQYPFYLTETFSVPNCSTISLAGDFRSDARFFVTTGVLSMIYSLVIGLFYVKFEEKYKNNAMIPMIDFVITLTLAMFWLSGSAAWANGLTGLKTVTTQVDLKCKDCQVQVNSFSSLNVSVILGFLNFFLWASDLWFVYKETAWFVQKQTTVDGAGSPTN